MPLDSTAYCTTPGTNWFAEVLRSAYCGVATVFSVPAETYGGAVEDVTDTFGGAVEDVTDFGGGAVSDVADAANPLNLLGLGFGLSFGGLVAAVGVGTVGAFAVDQLVFAGAGTSNLLRRLK